MILKGCEPRFASIHQYWWPGVRRKNIPIVIRWNSFQSSKSAIWVTKLGATFGMLHMIFGLLGLVTYGGADSMPFAAFFTKTITTVGGGHIGSGSRNSQNLV